MPLLLRLLHLKETALKHQASHQNLHLSPSFNLISITMAPYFYSLCLGWLIVQCFKKLVAVYFRFDLQRLPFIVSHHPIFLEKTFLLPMVLYY